MGLLSEGEPLSWNETKKWADHVRQHGVLQFIELYKKLETRKVSNLQIHFTLKISIPINRT